MTKVKNLIAAYEEISAEEKHTLDRRKKRPAPGALHIQELEAMMLARVPKGIMPKLYVSNWNHESVEVSFTRDSSIPWQQYRRDAYAITYWDYSYLYQDANGWIRNEYTIRTVLKQREEELAKFQKYVMELFRDQAGIVTKPAPASLKGKPRRATKRGDFDTHYRKLTKSRPSDGVNVIDLMPTVPAMLDSSRTWGIEIEVAGARGVTAPFGWDAVGDGSLRSPYTSDDCDCGCGSCVDYNDHDCGEDECPGYGEEDDSKEFVSPILHGVRASGIDQICDDVRYEPQNDTAGVHVHVGTDGMTPRQIGGLVYAYGLLERMLESSYTRNDREYCESLNTDDVRRVLSKARKVTDKKEMGVLDRYVTVNVQALSKHGTIEFRAMGPVYDSEYLHKWAMFCREMVNVAASNAPQRVWDKVSTFDDVLDVFRKYGSELNMVEAQAAAPVEAKVLVA